MAWANSGNGFGSAGTKTAGTTLSATYGFAHAAGTVIIVGVVGDNLSAAGGASSDHSLADQAGNTWTKIAEWTTDGGGVGSGVTVSLWYSKLTNAVTAAQTVTATFASSVAARGIGISPGFTIGAGNDVSVGVVTSNGIDGSDAFSLSLSSLTDADLIVPLFGAEGPTGDSFTQDTGYSNFSTGAAVGTSGGSAVTNVHFRWGYRIVSGFTSDSYNPTLSGARDRGGIMVALRETSSSTPKTGTDSGSGSETASRGAQQAESGAATDTAAQTFDTVRTESGTATDAAIVAVPVTASDSATATDVSQAPAVTHSTTESGAGADSVGSASRQAAEAAAGTDAATQAYSTTRTESGAATDAAAQSVAAATTPETGSGADVAAQTASDTRTDSAAATEASTASAALVASDSAAASDASTLTVPGTNFVRPDSAAATDTAIVPAKDALGTDAAAATDASSRDLRLADSAAASDVSSASRLVTESAVASDATGPAARQASETGTAADSAAQAYSTTRTDAGDGTDASTVTQGANNLVRTESAAATDTAIETVAHVVGDSAAAAEASSAAASHVRTDVGAGTEAGAPALFVTEQGAFSEIAATGAAIVAAETATAIDDATRRLEGRLVEMVADFLGPKVGASIDRGFSEPFYFTPRTIYVWDDGPDEIEANGERNFVLRVVFTADDRGEHGTGIRERGTTAELDAARATMLAAMNDADAPWQAARATIEPRTAQAYGVRGLGLTIRGQRL